MSAYGVAAGLGRAVQSGLILYLDAANSKSIVSGSTTWTDISRNGNNGTLTGGPTYNGANGGTIVFDGTDDYVNCGTITTGGKITVNAWIKFSIAANQHIVDSSSNTWHLALLDTNRPYFWNGTTYHTAAQALSTSTWYMITGVQGSTLDVYVNGGLSQSLASNLNVGSGNVNIGRWQSGTRPYNGNIAQVSIYNRALSATEVLQHYNMEKKRFGLS
jgi:hypothetical protein